ncbi:hypothetical protein Trydic_g23762 [Trypoxylus dichotomus]
MFSYADSAKSLLKRGRLEGIPEETQQEIVRKDPHQREPDLEDGNHAGNIWTTKHTTVTEFFGKLIRRKRKKLGNPEAVFKDP